MKRFVLVLFGMALLTGILDALTGFTSIGGWRLWFHDTYVLFSGCWLQQAISKMKEEAACAVTSTQKN